MNRRVVFDTTTVLSALFSLMVAWRGPASIGEKAVALRSFRALQRRNSPGYLNIRSFGCLRTNRRELLADYVPYCEIVEPSQTGPHVCRDENDQPFLDLAQAGGASLLVSGDKDLLVMKGLTDFQIETPEAYRLRVVREP